MLEAITANEPLEPIVATGRDRRSALGTLVAGVNRLLEGNERELTGRSVRFDVERNTFGETAQALLEAALDLAGEEQAVGIVTLDGLIKTDDGFVGWGSLLLGEKIRARPVPVLQSLMVEQEPGGWRLTAKLRR
jgi:hypothetical protein